jgi:hypothetical protein
MSKLKTTYNDDISTVNAVKYDLDDFVDTFLNPPNVNKSEWNFLDQVQVLKDSKTGINIRNDLKFCQNLIFPIHELAEFLESKPVNKRVWLSDSMKSERVKVIHKVRELLSNLELYSCLCKLLYADNEIQGLIVARFVQELLKLINGVNGEQTDECLHVNIDIKKKMDKFMLNDLIMGLLKLVEQDYVVQRHNSKSLMKENVPQKVTPQVVKIEAEIKPQVAKMEVETKSQLVNVEEETKPPVVKIEEKIQLPVVNEEEELKPQVVKIEETEVYVNLSLYFKFL